jgi:hypothetical protein
VELDEKFHGYSFYLGDELLPPVDVVGRAGDRCVDHEVNRESGDVGRSDHSPYGERSAQFLAPRF